MNIQIRQAHLEDLYLLAPRLREEDRQEVETATGRSVREALERAWFLSEECYVASLQPRGGPVEKLPFLVFGVGVSVAEQAGVIWMLSTPDIRRAGVKITRWARTWLKAWLRQYGTLTNIVDTRNAAHVAWLERLGARFQGQTVIRGVVFKQFWIDEVKDVRTGNHHGRDLRSAVDQRRGGSVHGAESAVGREQGVGSR